MSTLVARRTFWEIEEESPRTSRCRSYSHSDGSTSDRDSFRKPVLSEYGDGDSSDSSSQDLGILDSANLFGRQFEEAAHLGEWSSIDMGTIVASRTFWEIEEAILPSARCRSYSDPLCGLCASAYLRSTCDQCECESWDSTDVGGSSWDRDSLPTSVLSEDGDGESSDFKCQDGVLKEPVPQVASDGFLSGASACRSVIHGLTQCGDIAQRTTLMFKNLHSTCTRARLREFLDAIGFAGQYDFVYLPINFRTMESCRYGFVNMVTDATAKTLSEVAGCAREVGILGCEEGELEVCWSETMQGIEACIERYRNSPLRHATVPEQRQPLLLSCGLPIAFPPPTKVIKEPRLRRVN